MRVTKSLLKNLSLITVAEFIARLLNFATVIYLARVLGVESYGLWVFVSTLFMYLMLFNNLGLDIYGIRECGQPERTASVLTNILAIKLFLFALIVVALVLASLFLNDQAIFSLLLVLMGSLLLNDLAPQWFFQVKERFGYIATAKIAQSVVYFILVLLLVHSGDDLVVLAWVYVAGFGLLFAVMFFGYKDSFDFALVDRASWRQILTVSVVMASSLLMTEVYTSVDKLMLKIWYPMSYIGYYEAAFKIYSIMLILFGVIWTVFAPKVARKDLQAYRLFLVTILFVGILSSLAMLIFSNALIHLFFGSRYAYAQSTLFIFGFIGVVVAAGFALSAPLAIWGYEKLWFKTVLLAALLNILLNILLIPFFDIRGAAVATLIAELVVVLLITVRIKLIYHEVFHGA